jgi:hypothetical protein
MFGNNKKLALPPPLGAGLFNELEAVGGIASVLPDSLKAQFRRDFEVRMAQLFETRPQDVMRFQREMAHYLASFSPGPDNAYKALIRTLGRRRVIYCTLNYDLLFELSAHAMNLAVTYGPDFREGCVSLLKLHGSANFWPDLGSNKYIGCTMVGKQAEIAAPIQICDQDETLRKCTLEDSMAPAIAVFTNGKPVRVCPKYVHRHRRWWTDAVATAPMILIVGVKINPADSHIWATLGKSQACITYFGYSKDDRTAFDQWKVTWDKRNAFFESGDFKRSISRIRHKLSYVRQMS